jgi:hypothetical protein
METKNVVIIGPRKFKWNPEQFVQARIEVRDIILSYPKSLTTIISGHCPVGKPKYWCYDLERFVDDPNKYAGYGYMFTASTVYTEGGIDTLTEIIAQRLRYHFRAFPAPAKDWKDKVVYSKKKDSEFPYKYKVKSKLLGYKSRNIKMVQEGDVIHAVIPFNPAMYCKYHGDYHSQGGTCWTLRYANQIGKKTEIRIVK